jgi:hypothetical protein
MSLLMAGVAFFVIVMFIANMRLIKWNGEVRSCSQTEHCGQVWPVPSE